MEYYVRDTKGRIAGPFTVEAIKKAATEGRILPTWHLSSTQEKWTLAANVPDLFPASEIVQPVVAPTSNQRQASVHERQLAVFLDTFKGGKERFKDAMPWIQKARLWWVNLTLPKKGFIITEVRPSGVTRLRYDFANEQPSDVTEEDYEKELKAGIERVDWYIGFAILVVFVGCISAMPDFGEQPNPTFGVLKSVFFIFLLISGYVCKVRHSKTFVGYVLSPEFDAKLKTLQNTFATLSRCSRVWALRVKPSDPHWKYSVGGIYQVGRLPVANFGPTIRNIETNITFCGVGCQQLTIYFLPDKLLVIDGNDVRHLAYNYLDVGHDHVDYLEIHGHIFKDSQIIGHRWLHSRKNGLPDRRYKLNLQISIVRCGILTLGVPNSAVGLITTDPNAPETFTRSLPRP